MAKRAPYVISYECIMCSSCQDKCKLGAISRGDLQYEINAALCVGCGLCAKACPAEAIFQVDELPPTAEEGEL